MLHKSNTFNNSKDITKNNNIKFSRYLFMRYMVALFFFSNIYWGLLLLLGNYYLILLPILLLVVFVRASYEQIKLYSALLVSLNATKNAFKSQIIVNILLIFICCSPFFTNLFPAFSGTLASRIFIGLILLLGIGIGFLSLYKIKKIQNNTDKFYTKFNKIVDF
ncbi:MAG: hypothetical protein Q4A90_09585 [Streptococcus sp.]|nr:hypothetical protein [Streptococcus sp.]